MKCMCMSMPDLCCARKCGWLYGYSAARRGAAQLLCIKLRSSKGLYTTALHTRTPGSVEEMKKERDRQKAVLEKLVEADKEREKEKDK